MSAVDQEFERAGFPGASHSVARHEDHQGACVATWSWGVSTPLVNAQEWPSGLTLTWSSLSGLWTYVLVDEHGLENTELLPVPALAAPSAVIALLPALMDGRRGLLPRSEERWEHAGLLESWAESAAVLGDDKYDAAYQAAEEEAESFLRWQEELDAAGVMAGQQGAGLSEDSGEPAGLIRYRVVAQRTVAEHDGAATLTHYAYARSVEEAVTKVRQAYEKPGGVYGDQGLYRVVEVCEDGPEGQERQEEDARRRFVSMVMEAAQQANKARRQHVEPYQYGILCDFFTRAIVFPGQRPYDDGMLHTSDPARALSSLLLSHLAIHGMRVDDTPAPGELLSPAERPAAREVEDAEAPAELVDRVLAVCEQHYAAVTGTNSKLWDRESARELVDVALRTVRLAERETYPQTLDAYLHEHGARLERLWHRYGPGGMFAGELVLIDLPGCFVLCERIETTPLWLEELWAKHGQEETALERLQNSWLYDTGEKDGR
ncbi:hypothetical protein GCM10010249_60310 [Streptomyces roseolilacinus]|uniref:Uncharacterized protein n=1 Tax=Streptomyces roseolilacinus TaxID=66904 RepID=A0A918B5S7_9ACTN|nr:hypothetical protein GCM10010249_60310 [Streptomyces roseolilacinus]